MSRKFKFNSLKEAEPTLKNDPPKIAFGFSALYEISYTDATKKGDFFIRMLSRLKKLSNITWAQAETSGRHSFGTEKLPVTRLNDGVRLRVPAGMDSLIVFRATGDNHAFLGYRDGNVFQIIFIEYKFGDIYKH